jgi:tetratricopeptide (TPR) repeat protein
LTIPLRVFEKYLFPAGLLIAVVGLYGGFLANPPVYDSLFWFQNGGMTRYANGEYSFGPRWLPYLTLGLTYKYFGLDNPIWYRLPGLLLHAAVAISLYDFLKCLWQAILPSQEDGQPTFGLLAFLAALIFAVHPVAVYGAGYLIERTLVMATLFALLMWWAFLRGLVTGRKIWLWVSVLFYVLALSSKQNVIMAPAVSAVLLILWWRTHGIGDGQSLRSWLLRLAPVFLAYALLGLMVVMQMKGIMGKTYEPQGEDAVAQVANLGAAGKLVYPFSIFNQAALFFKYIGLWLVPNPAWLSIDMREPFVTSFWAWPQTLGFALFVIYPLLAMALLWRGGRLGVLGFALITPWLLYATELSTVRIQEPFVLYRSYLWAVPAFAVVVVLLGRMQSNRAGLYLALVALIMFPIAFQRLQTFSSALVLWDDAARLVERQGNPIGADRIFLNRGIQLRQQGDYKDAIADFNRASQGNSAYYLPYILTERGQAYFLEGRYEDSLRDFNLAISRNNKIARSFMRRGQTLEALGRRTEAQADFREACRQGYKAACDKLGK